MCCCVAFTCTCILRKNSKLGCLKSVHRNSCIFEAELLHSFAKEEEEEEDLYSWDFCSVTTPTFLCLWGWIWASAIIQHHSSSPSRLQTRFAASLRVQNASLPLCCISELSLHACHIWSEQYYQCSAKLLTCSGTRVMQRGHRKCDLLNEVFKLSFICNVIFNHRYKSSLRGQINSV